MSRMQGAGPVQINRVQRYGLFLTLVWTLLIMILMYLNYRDHEKEILILGRMQCLAFFEKDLLYRRWASRHGGVYVPATETTQPNPYLSHIPERDITTPSGRQLTLMNPAYMTRQVFEMAEEKEGAGRGHITSLNPIRPENAPDPWETGALQAFANGAKEISQVSDINGKPYHRYMKPLFVEKSCLKCHSAQGYHEGDLRGGISVSVPLEPFIAIKRTELQADYLRFAVIWLLGLGGIGFGTLRLKRLTAVIVERTVELEQQVEERKTTQEALEEQAVLLEEEIAERQKTEKEMELFISLINSSADIMVIADPNGCFKKVNPACTRVLGYGAEEMLTKPFIDFVHPDDRQATLDEMTRQMQCGHTINFENRYLCKDGSVRYLSWHASFIAAEGITCATARDVTERKQLEEQLLQSQKMEAVGQLAGGVAHDFNNILSVIMGYAGMLKLATNLDEPQQERVDHILSAAEKAAELSRGLLAFSRKQQLATRTVNLNDMVRNLEKFLIRVIGEDVKLQPITHKINLPVAIDTGQIEQALINLATNARDAMPHGGTLTIETSAQDLDASFAHVRGYGRPGRYAVITVTDTGSGINEEIQPKIFEPFFTTKEVGKGTGLGLAIVYGIIKQHNGFIQLSSEPDKGTTFRIYLPLLDNEELAQQEPPTQPAPAGGNENILVVEDDPAVRQLTAMLLEEYGYHVIRAEDGKEAVSQFIANRESIDLILMDMIMPGQSGQAAAEEIRQLKPEARILFTSGYTADFISSKGIDEGSIELLMKPVHPLELLRKVREILDRPV
ncbi:MAG: DUF3365 domain-containing protein [Geobacter sp.]|nr:DUF3365 domain-containing protein [Geobacter sp.]